MNCPPGGMIESISRRPIPQTRAGTRWPGILLAFLLVWTRLPALSGADTPVTPNPSPEAQSLLAYFSDIYGKKILSGQQDGWRGTNEGSFELNYIKTATGKLPVLLGLDLSPYTRVRTSPGARKQHDLVKHAIDWYSNRNGIVSLCWHWSAPLGDRAIYTKDTRFDLRQAMIEGTPEHAAILRDLDDIAEELKLLQSAHVPVLWRPLHEANGRWFWWGAQGPEPFKKLWRLMFERFTVHHKLNNLIWVFSPGAAIDLADWYPGDEYVDIVGQDHYPMDDNHGPAKDVFDELVAFGRGTKLVALSELGPIPDPDRLVAEKAGWLFFITWSGNQLTGKNTRTQLKEVFNNPYVLNLGDLPNLKNYPFQPAARAAQLAFPAPPGDVAFNGARRLPLTVAVRDEQGRTVRNGSYTVTLALDKNPGNGRLIGTLTASTLNGIATFPDLRIDQPDDGYALRAAAEGLRSATSADFRVGPGNGITHEWWTDLDNARLADISRASTPPAGREIIASALEVPFNNVTNWSSRFRGLLLPPLSGRYVFWIASESVSELWLGADSTPSHKIRIAAVTTNTPYVKWPHTHEAESAAVDLEAGKSYYLEVVQRQKSGSDHLSVRWRLPDGVEQRPIPGDRLGAFVPVDPALKLARKKSGP